MQQSRSQVLLLLAAGPGAPRWLPPARGMEVPALCGSVLGLASAVSLLDASTSVQDPAAPRAFQRPPAPRWPSTVLNSCVTHRAPFAALGMDPSKPMSKSRRSQSPGKEKPNPDLAGKGPVCSAEPRFQIGDEPKEPGTRLAGALAGRCPAAFALGRTRRCSCRAFEHQVGAGFGLLLIPEQL